jgi:hypothetical protein
MQWYMPPLVADDDRTVRAVRIIEQVLPWATLRFEVSEEGIPIALPDRDRWLLAAAARGEFPLIANNDESRAVTIDALPVDASEYPPTQLQVHAWVPPESEVLRRAVELLGAIGLVLGAWWGKASQSSTAARIALQTILDFPDPERPPPGLPGLAMRKYLDGPEVPHHLGWINYWSQASCARIGFPDPARHAELLQRAHQVEGGGWVVQLTDESLDLDIPSHLQALARAYELLPAIGGRDMDTRTR